MTSTIHHATHSKALTERRWVGVSIGRHNLRSSHVKSPVPLPQARSRVPVCCICFAGMPGVCMMPGIVSVLAGLGVRSVILLAAVRVRVLCECVSDGSAVTRLLARACALHMLC